MLGVTGNMTTLEQDLKKQILGRSKAEKVFRPWWDTLEDYLLNSLVLLGKFNPLVHVLVINTRFVRALRALSRERC